MGILIQANQVLNNLTEFQYPLNRLCTDNQKRLSEGKNVLGCTLYLSDGGRMDLIPLKMDPKGQGVVWGISGDHIAIRGISFSRISGIDFPLSDAIITTLNAGNAFPNLDEAPSFLKIRSKLAEVKTGHLKCEVQKDEKLNETQMLFYRYNCGQIADRLQEALKKTVGDQLGTDAVGRLESLVLVPADTTMVSGSLNGSELQIKVSYTRAHQNISADSLYELFEKTL